MTQITIAGRPLVPGENPIEKGSKTYDEWKPVVEVDARDVKCADNWIPRHPDLIRLTGKHPFNSEPPHEDVMEQGWLTPVSLHFVRNHGAVPRLQWDSHKIRISGVVNKPIDLSMAELAKLPAVTIPCLISCCGNRRKEVNMLKNSQGFSWGPGAVSVNFWTGARLSDVLKAAGIKTRDEGAKWIHFTGPKGELPKGDDGSYGTHMTYAHAMDPGSDVLVAYKQNGQFLHPDHGFPCRMLIPGWIGGRMVKWLSHIHVSSEGSNNWYHHHDNKVLPPHVDADKAANEGWWQDPAYILYELPVNSTISAPGHDERVYLDTSKPYTMRGYAYSGGGRKITRVEVSFDGGKSYSQPAKLIFTEEPNAYERYWTWVFWELEVDTFDFVKCDEVLCRAWDWSQNTQPREMTWTLLGQGNNSEFRLKCHKEVDENGRICVRFQQPAPMLPGPLGNVGWREEDAAAVAPKPAPAKPAAAAGGGLDRSKKYVTADMLDQHQEEDSVWFAYQGQVFDGTKFLDDHPGGADSMLMAGGTDATDDFNAVHSDDAKQQLLEYYIAEMAPEGAEIPADLLFPDPRGRRGVLSKAEDSTDDQPFLSAKAQKKVTLVEKEKLSHNVTRFRFSLDAPDRLLGLPTGKHMLIRKSHKNKEGEEEMVMRAYTPTTANETRGYFELVVKIYWANEVERFPDGGKFSQILQSLELGDFVEVKGPIGHFHYRAPGVYLNHKAQGECSRINMICGGTGITPMYQVLKQILSDQNDKTQLRLLYANQTEGDILVRKEMEELAAEKPDRFKLHYTLSNAPEEWKYSSGFINLEMCQTHLFEHAPGTITLLCGPPPMLKFACYPALEEMGYEKGLNAIEF